MTTWVDAQLSPRLVSWTVEAFGIETFAVRNLGLRDAKDREIFLSAREAGAVIMTKDSDFLALLDRLGPPPQVLWITCGNTSNARLKEVLTQILSHAMNLLEKGEPVVEISDKAFHG